jgi:hypothetical protein
MVFLVGGYKKYVLLKNGLTYKSRTLQRSRTMCTFNSVVFCLGTVVKLYNFNKYKQTDS